MPQVQVLYRPPEISRTYGIDSASPFFFPRTIPRTQTKNHSVYGKGMRTVFVPPRQPNSPNTPRPFPHASSSRISVTHQTPANASTPARLKLSLFLRSTVLTMPLTLPCASSLPLPERNRLKPYPKTLSQPSQLSHAEQYQHFSVGQFGFFKMSQLSHCPKFKVAQSYNSPFGYASGNLP